MRFTATQLWQIKEALREELKEMRMFDPTKEMGAQGTSRGCKMKEGSTLA